MFALVYYFIQITKKSQGLTSIRQNNWSS